jgi:ergothioneine biosynthesis protein EgtB
MIAITQTTVIEDRIALTTGSTRSLYPRTRSMIRAEASARASSISTMGWGRRLRRRRACFFFGFTVLAARFCPAGFFRCARCAFMRRRDLMQTSDGESLIEWYLRNRARSRMLFDSVSPRAYEARPISLRNPICFYEGHIPAFAVNTLLKGWLNQPGIDAGFERLFERGIDPEDETHVGAAPEWPSRDAILDYARRADERIRDVLENGDLGDARPVLSHGQVARTILEHEEMHQETVCYLLSQLPQADKIRPAGLRSEAGGDPPIATRVSIPAGTATLGLDPRGAAFGWDNEFPRHEVAVPAFEIDVHDVTNAAFVEFVDAGGYERPELWCDHGRAWLKSTGAKHPEFWLGEEGRRLWRGVFEDVALPAAWPVYVTWFEADAWARWKKRRLPSEPEYHRAAFATPSGEERPHPWGDAAPDRTRGNFGFQRFDPAPVGSFPAGASAFGVHDLVGNGWEWTRTPFAGFPGFSPMPAYPVYSADFFDGRHFVLKGASPVTAPSMIRRTFRNWFRDGYPYVYATFRTVS